MESTHQVVSFETFMERALYGPDGFYTGDGFAGRRGDFITSPEIGPLFGAVFARFVDAEWDRLGRPDRFTVLDVGAGPGTLARSFRDAAPDCLGAVEYVAVEISAAQRERHPDWVTSTATAPDEEITGVIIANELLDNLPFQLVVYDDGWREARVDISGPNPQEILGPRLEPVPAVLPTNPPHGARAPLQHRANRWVREMYHRLSGGTLVVVDYGVGRTAELALRPWRDWLRTYRRQASGGHYLAAPGSQDITTDVAFDQLPPSDSLRTQAQWLQLHGIGDLVAEGKQYWEQHASAPDLAAIKMRSRVSEAEALTDPAGLGAFWVAEWRR